MRFMLSGGKYISSLLLGNKDIIMTLDTGSPITVLRGRYIEEALKDGYEEFIRLITKYKPRTFCGVGGDVIKLYPAILDKAILSGVELVPFACYVDVSNSAFNNLVGTDIISSCVFCRSYANYCIDMDILNTQEYINSFKSEYREFVHSTIDIVSELQSNITVSATDSPYLDDLFGAASVAIGK